MSALRTNNPSMRLRLQGLYEARQNGTLRPGPDAECARTTLGQRLGIAALHAGREENDTACAAALLAIAGVPDSQERRAAVLAAIEDVRRTVRLAVDAGGPH